MNLTTAGDLGDIIYIGAILHGIGGRHSILLRDDGNTKGIVRREHIIAPLMEAQEYVMECRPIKASDAVEWESEKFRPSFHSCSSTLVDAHYRHGLSVHAVPKGLYGEKQWLQVEPRKVASVVMARSSRYQNWRFPWRQIVEHYKDAVFLGTKAEHAEFEEKFGRVSHLPTGDLLQAAQVIAGSELFIGNQSSPNAIAEGLKHRLIQETSPSQPDCIWHREGAVHCFDGSCVLPDIQGSGELDIASLNIKQVSSNNITCPPGGWHYNGVRVANGFEVAVRKVMQNAGVSEDEAKTLLSEANRERLKDWTSGILSNVFATVDKARENARKRALLFSSNPS